MSRPNRMPGRRPAMLSKPSPSLSNRLAFVAVYRSTGSDSGVDLVSWAEPPTFLRTPTL
jgi:hypothetical protein